MGERIHLLKGRLKRREKILCRVLSQNTQVVSFFSHMLRWLGNFKSMLSGKKRKREINCVVSSLWESNFVAFRFYFISSIFVWEIHVSSINAPMSFSEKRSRFEKSDGNITWHCCGPPCRVGDAVFGLCFFTGVDETGAGKLEFDDGVTVAARVVMVSGCWVETTIEADDALCKAFEDGDDATVSITLATEINWVVYNA